MYQGVIHETHLNREIQFIYDLRFNTHTHNLFRNLYYDNLNPVGTLQNYHTGYLYYLVTRACWVHDLWAALFWVTRACRERVDLQCSRARTTWEERQRCGHPGGARCQRGAGAGAVNVAWRDTGAQERKHKQVHQKSVKFFNFLKSSSGFCSSVEETQTVLLLVNSYSLTFILTFCSE